MILKHKLHKQIRQSVSPQVISYKDFMNRIYSKKDNRKFDDPEHILKLASTPLYKKDSIVDQNGRECTKCKTYKLRSDYYTGYHICKECWKTYYNNKKTFNT